MDGWSLSFHDFVVKDRARAGTFATRKKNRVDRPPPSTTKPLINTSTCAPPRKRVGFGARTRDLLPWWRLAWCRASTPPAATWCPAAGCTSCGFAHRTASFFVVLSTGEEARMCGGGRRMRVSVLRVDRVGCVHVFITRERGITWHSATLAPRLSPDTCPPSIPPPSAAFRPTLLLVFSSPTFLSPFLRPPPHAFPLSRTHLKQRSDHLYHLEALALGYRHRRPRWPGNCEGRPLPSPLLLATREGTHHQKNEK